ncbi:DNA ligase D [Alkalicoccobacillus gibsonii]|uniref:DNA ligase D n=1 Tax=Alkalicoccobacillus gibsonii TaxID=79881 RepID=A0ABU9VHA1_9BACI
MKPMLTTHTSELPRGDQWLYEPKYDGFRCLLIVSPSHVRLQSRNGRDMSSQFPEIIEAINNLSFPYPSFTLDSELVYLRSPFCSDFSKVHKRSKLRAKRTIETHSLTFPCSLIVFDLIERNQESLTHFPLRIRKEYLDNFFSRLSGNHLIPIQSFTHIEPLLRELSFEAGEGILAKKITSQWNEGKRSSDWLKWKLPKQGTVILTHYQSTNQYFTGQVYKDESLMPVVQVAHGFSEEKRQTLISLFKQKGKKYGTDGWVLPPGICADIFSIGINDENMREPRFSDFNLTTDPLACTYNQLKKELTLPKDYIELTHPDKPIWDHAVKDDYLFYLQHIAPHLLPFLHSRVLTVIRFPHGGGDERFYQKNRPESAPEYVTSVVHENIDYILCNGYDTLLWLGNQLALEFHIPFQPHTDDCPCEMVIDLDPPSVEEFHLAVKAAKLAKEALDFFKLTAFVKTSGGKGLQLYIPLPFNQYSYEETRSFLLFLCEFLCEQRPDLFTLERLKKKRKGRLYLDYLQHDAGKTIVAPYSTRGDTGYVATPLEWEEIEDESLHPSQFTIWTVLERLEKRPDPFGGFNNVRVQQPFREVLERINHQ